MGKTNNFAFRFKDAEQKDRAASKAKQQNRSLNNYLSNLVDSDLNSKSIHYSDIIINKEQLLESVKKAERRLLKS